MYIDDYKRWLEAELEDPALTEELKRIEGQDDSPGKAKRESAGTASVSAQRL